MIPVYIVTGFIGSGKSTFINEQVQHRKKLGGTALISAEEGSVEAYQKAVTARCRYIEYYQPYESILLRHYS